MRRFERDSELWEIELDDARVIVRRYEEGTLVVDEASQHTSELRAKWEADKVCSRLTGQGYTRVDEDSAPLGRKELEDALRANPDDLDARLVYADWLSDHGDDWGQLIAVQHALLQLPRGVPRDQMERTELMLRFRLSSRLWGALGETVYNEETQKYLCDLLEAEWHCGFLREVSIPFVDDELFPTLVAGLCDQTIAILLRDVKLHAYEWPAGSIEAFVSRTWPMVERVMIATADGDVRLDARRLEPLVDGVRFPKLAQLDVSNTSETDALCEALANGAVAPRIASVTLQVGEFSDAGVAALANARFPALQKLELSGSMPRDAHARLRHLAPSVRVVPTNE